MNPVPVDIKPRVLTTAIDLDSGTASLDLALSVADYFEISPDHASQIAAEVGAAVLMWRKVAAGFGLRTAEIDRMSSAFDHADLKQALQPKRTARKR